MKTKLKPGDVVVVGSKRPKVYAVMKKPRKAPPLPRAERWYALSWGDSLFAPGRNLKTTRANSYATKVGIVRVDIVPRGWVRRPK